MPHERHRWRDKSESFGFLREFKLLKYGEWVVFTSKMTIWKFTQNLQMGKSDFWIFQEGDAIFN